MLPQKKARQAAANFLQDLSVSLTTTPAHSDKADKHVVNMLHTYHDLAQSIWPMAQPTTSTDPTKLRVLLTNSDDRQIKHFTRLRDMANQQIHTALQDNPHP